MSGGLTPAPEVAERVLELAAAGGGDCIVLVSDAFDADVRFANNTTTTNGVRRDRHVSVVRILDRRDGRCVGSASGSGPLELGALVAAAEADAEQAPPAGDAAPLIEGDAAADFTDAPLETDLSVFAGVLPELAEAFGRARSSDVRLAGFATHAASTVYLASSTGLRRRIPDRSGTLELVARADGGLRSAWAGVGTVDFADVSLAALDARLSERLAWAERRVELPPGRYETILPPDAVADLVIEAFWAMGGKDAEEGGTAYAAPGGRTRVGEAISSLPFHLWSDPSAAGLRCPDVFATGVSSAEASVFDNGAVLEATDWFRDGRVDRLRYHRADAAERGVPFAPAIDNLLLELPGSTASLEDLVAACERGLLLTCLWYIREVDPATLLLTGLTRDGVFLVEHGEVVGAVNNFRFNESPLDLLRDTIAASAPERALSREWGEWMDRTVMPALRVADFNMSSVSPAS